MSSRLTTVLFAIALLVSLADKAMALPPPQQAPDVGSSGLLLAMAFTGIAIGRSFFGKKN